MSNPSPEPSAESLAEAREVHGRLFGLLPASRFLIDGIALALDAAKRSSRREALGQAAELVGGMKQRRSKSEVLRGVGDDEDAAGWKPLTLSELALLGGAAAALRALMEAE